MVILWTIIMKSNCRGWKQVSKVALFIRCSVEGGRWKGERWALGSEVEHKGAYKQFNKRSVSLATAAPQTSLCGNIRHSRARCMALAGPLPSLCRCEQILVQFSVIKWLNTNYCLSLIITDIFKSCGAKRWGEFDHFDKLRNQNNHFDMLHDRSL